MEQINAICQFTYNLIINLAYWVCGIVIGCEILKNAVQRNFEGCIRAIISGAGGYACIYLVKLVLDLIKQAFS